MKREAAESAAAAVVALREGNVAAVTSAEAESEEAKQLVEWEDLKGQAAHIFRLIASLNAEPNETQPLMTKAELVRARGHGESDIF